MKSVLLAITSLSLISVPAFGKAFGDEVRCSEFNPPSFSTPAARKHFEHKMTEALRKVQNDSDVSSITSTSEDNLAHNVTSTTTSDI